MTEHYELTNVPCQGEKCAVAPKVGFGEPIRIPPRPFSVIAGLISTAASLVGTQDRWLSEPRLPRGRAIRASTSPPLVGDVLVSFAFRGRLPILISSATINLFTAPSICQLALMDVADAS